MAKSLRVFIVGLLGVALLIPLAHLIAQMQFDQITVAEVRNIFGGLQVAVVEESLFRLGGIWLLSRVIPLKWAVVVSTLLFGASHLLGWSWQFSLVAGIAGCLYSWAYVQSDFNLWVPVWLHSICIWLMISLFK